jgi:hypothetical protein
VPVSEGKHEFSLKLPGAAALPPKALPLPLLREKSAPKFRPDLTPRTNLLQMKRAANVLQSAFRRRRWGGLLNSLSRSSLFYAIGFRPLLDASGEVIGVRGPSGAWYVGRSYG